MMPADSQLVKSRSGHARDATRTRAKAKGGRDLGRELSKAAARETHER